MQTHSLASTARRSLLGVTLVAATLAPSAMAQGGPGGGGGGGGAPVPTTFPAAACDGSLDGPNAFGDVVTIPIRDGNCLSLLVSATNTDTVWAVTAAPGWTYVVKQDQPDQIDVRWTNTASPLLTHEYRKQGTSVRVS